MFGKEGGTSKIAKNDAIHSITVQSRSYFANNYMRQTTLKQKELTIFEIKNASLCKPFSLLFTAGSAENTQHYYFQSVFVF